LWKVSLAASWLRPVSSGKIRDRLKIVGGQLVFNFFLLQPRCFLTEARTKRSCGPDRIQLRSEPPELAGLPLALDTSFVQPSAERCDQVGRFAGDQLHPITGMTGCCAPAACGQRIGDTAAPPSASSFDHLVGAVDKRDGTVGPSAVAVLKLMISSTFDCWTGKSAGLSPARRRGRCRLLA
jgi:hypothetical protein